MLICLKLAGAHMVVVDKAFYISACGGLVVGIPTLLLRNDFFASLPTSAGELSDQHGARSEPGVLQQAVTAVVGRRRGAKASQRA